MTRRPWLPSVALGFGLGLAGMAVALSEVAFPLFLLARVLEPANGLDRPFVRTGLLAVALPAAVVAAVVAGLVGGRWYRRGGRWAREDSPQP